LSQSEKGHKPGQAENPMAQAITNTYKPFEPRTFQHELFKHEPNSMFQPLTLQPRNLPLFNQDLFNRKLFNPKPFNIKLFNYEVSSTKFLNHLCLKGPNPSSLQKISNWLKNS
jgi:hypothetical protein